MRLADFDFDLPPDRIAQHPARPRDAARLLHVARDGLADRIVRDLPALLRPGDVLVVNDTRVIPAQLTARRGDARIGITLDQPRADGTWHALARNARRLHAGDELRFDGSDDLRATVLAARCRMAAWCWHSTGTTRRSPRRCSVPARLPCRPISRGPPARCPRTPTTTRRSSPRTKARSPRRRRGCISRRRCWRRWSARGVRRVTITLHVGAGTFLPVRTDDVAQHRMHAERGEITAEAAAAHQCARSGGRVVAVGTTSLRLLETAAIGRRHASARSPATRRCSSCRATGSAPSICC